MASFLIVLIMMIVITLIVLGLTQVTRRNAREALDRQLSSQAFYAAESGTNVTTKTITDFINANGFAALPEKSSCPTDYDPHNADGSGTPIQDLGDGVRYTCVLVDPDPSTLKYNPTRQGSNVVRVQANGNLRTLKFTWTKQSGGSDTTCTGGNPMEFPQAGNWSCDLGILRADLVADPDSNVNSLADNTTSLFMTPLGGHSGAMTLPNFNSINKAYVASASGCGTGTCSLTITLNPSISAYGIRLTSLYRDTPNTIISGTLANGSAATFSGAQAVVDTTGQAQDELRRIQVRVALTSTSDPDTIPANALSSSSDICKRFSIMPGQTVNPSNLCQ
jgi:hypothetical protein